MTKSAPIQFASTRRWFTAALLAAATSIASAQTAPKPAPPPMPAIRMPAPSTNGDQWQPGFDYIALMTPWMFTSKPGKVTLTIRHQYTVREYRVFEPFIAEWLKHKPDYIEVVRKPHVHYPHARAQARIFLTLQQLGREDLHLKLYDWIWEKAHYKVYHQLHRPDFPAIDQLNVDFAKANGIDEQQFKDIYFSQKMDLRVIDEEADTLWEGDSSFVINGRYMTDYERTSWRDLEKANTPENIARFFRLVEYLAADELKHSPAPTSVKP